MIRLPLKAFGKFMFNKPKLMNAVVSVRFNSTDPNSKPSVDKSDNSKEAPATDHAQVPKIEGSSSETSKSQPHNETHHKSSTAERVGATLHYAEERLSSAGHYAGQTYEELERNLMKAINESNQQRFRVYLIGTVLLILWVLAVFGTRIRKSFTKETAEIARETLENEALKLQTQEFALVVVQTILNDKEITAQAAAFLREASMAPDTQKALLLLTMHILQHEDSLKELTVLMKKLVGNLSNDKETVDKLVGLLSSVLQDPQLKKTLVELVVQLCKEPEVLQAISELSLELVARRDVIDATGELLVKASGELLTDEEVQDKSRAFVAEVMGDDMLQKEGGDALLNSVKHALKPGFIRMTGFSLIMFSFAVIRVLISPY